VHHDSTLLTRLFSQPEYASALRVWVVAARGWLPIAGANRLRSCRCTTFLAGVTSWTLRQDNKQRDDYAGDDRRGQWGRLKARPPAVTGLSMKSPTVAPRGRVRMNATQNKVTRDTPVQ